MSIRLFVLLVLLLGTTRSFAVCEESAVFADGFDGRAPSGMSLPCIIDGGTAASGVRDLHVVDLDGDGRNDLLVAQAFNVDRIAWYAGQGGGLFAARDALDDAFPDPVSLASGDFDGDGRVDLASLGFDGALRIHQGRADGLAPGQLIDVVGMQGNRVVAGDFDGQAGDDLVVIGQHSIDFFRSTGSIDLVKEVILDTKMAVDVLECMAIAAADMDGDGDLDVVVAETRGGVLYRNDGDGRFAPEVFTAERRILSAIQVLDADGNAWPDVVVQFSSGELLLYRDVGVQAASAGQLLFQAGPAALRSIAAVDLDGDGWQDLQMAFQQTLWHASNLQGQGFAAPMPLLVESGLFYNEVAVGDADGDGRPDLFWSAVNGRIGHIRAAR